MPVHPLGCFAACADDIQLASGCNSEQDAARVLGFTSVTWDNLSGSEQQPTTIEKSWVDLTDDERAAAMVLGFTRPVWDTLVAALLLLGLDQPNWDNGGLPESLSKPWSQLSSCGEDSPSHTAICT